MGTMKNTIGCIEETQAFQIAVPLTKEEKSVLNRIKRSTGKSIGHYVREAILEKLNRERVDRKIVSIFPGENK